MSTAAEREVRRLARAAAEEARLQALLAFELGLWGQGFVHVAGLDEVGAGTLAGPLVAAAVILHPNTSIPGVDDSKKLSKRKRETVAALVRERACTFALGMCGVEDLDQLNVLHAGLEAMRRAVVQLQPAPQHLLVDARVVPGVIMPQTAIVGGDRKSQSIAAASVLAKVERDAMMDRAAVEYPGYGFERHRGYGTAEHLEAIERLGLCPIHRRSFSPVLAVERGMSPRKPKQLGLF